MFTSISRQEGAASRMIRVKMMVSAAITGFLIFALFLEAISSSPKDR
jgi:hypothetical protein